MKLKGHSRAMAYSIVVTFIESRIELADEGTSCAGFFSYGRSHVSASHASLMSFGSATRRRLAAC